MDSRLRIAGMTDGFTEYLLIPFGQKAKKAGYIMDNKKKALKILRKKIIDELFVDRWHDVWFFPNKDGVKGWQGTAPILFVGLNPSTGPGHFPSPADQIFYSCLAKNGFCNAHITDIYKIRATGQKLPEIQRNNCLLRLNRNYLLDEVNILQPRLVVALGEASHHMLRKWLSGINKEQLLRVPHYSWAYRWGKKARFSKEMNDVRKRYSDTTLPPLLRSDVEKL